tara:strand:- start:370 stop:1011 length:642 start_codon:yes stop_codon:yes gene_type:complete
MKKLTDFWETEVPKDMKHFAEFLDSATVKYSIEVFEENTLSIVDATELRKCIDWGAGGGLLSKRLLAENPRIDLTIADISSESLNEAQRYIGAENVTKVQVSEDETEWERLLDDGCDMLFCYSVIQHFPSLEYWKNVSSFWEKLGPKYISLRTKIEDSSEEAREYYHNMSYLRGLVLSWDSLLEAFPSYKVLHKRDSFTRNKQRDGFLVLERR